MQLHLDKLHKDHIVNTLINNSVQKNFLSLKLIIKEEISIKDAKVSVHTLDNYLFIIYRHVAYKVHVTDL